MKRAKKPEMEKLFDRQDAAGRRSGDAWIYFEPVEVGVAVETSLVSSVVAEDLAPAGFRPLARGGCRAVVARGDEVGLARVVAAALRAMRVGK